MTKEGKKSLIGQLVDEFDALQGEFSDHLGNKVAWSKLRQLTHSGLMFMKNIGEHEIQVSSLRAYTSCSN